jgi:hypothetical protein
VFSRIVELRKDLWSCKTLFWENFLTSGKQRSSGNLRNGDNVPEGMFHWRIPCAFSFRQAVAWAKQQRLAEVNE